MQNLQAGALVNAFGNGLAYPFLFIYLHDVRGFGLGVTGLIVATNSTVGLVAGPLAGTLVDRFGGRRVLSTALLAMAVGYGSYPWVHHPWQGFAASAVAGIGNGAFWPAQSSLIAALSPPEKRHSAFAVQRMMMNLGIGLGAAAGGFVAVTSEPDSFTLLFLVDAATFVAYGLILGFVPSPGRAPPADGPVPRGYAHVLRHRVFMGVIGINFLLITAGIAQFEVLPAYVKEHAGVTERGIGWIYLVNTLTIVVAQLPIARLLEGTRRMRATAGVAVLWALSWLCVPLVADSFSRVEATVLFAVVLTAFAIGECLHGAVQAPLVTDLADHRLIGRYMAMSAFSWTVGFAAGPAIAGFVLDARPTALWIGAAVVLLATGGLALALERALPPSTRRTPTRVSPEGSPEPSRMERPAMLLDDPLSTDAKPAPHQADTPARPRGRRRRARRAARR